MFHLGYADCAISVPGEEGHHQWLKKGLRGKGVGLFRVLLSGRLTRGQDYYRKLPRYGIETILRG